MINKFFFILIVVSSCMNDRFMDESFKSGELSGMDYKIFQNTKIYNLAKAVQNNNLNEIKLLVKHEKMDLNFQDPKFGNSLLMMTVMNQQYQTCKLLLELSADVNLHNYDNGTSAIIIAAEINNFFGSNTKFLELLISHGANPNDIERGTKNLGGTFRKTPLIASCQILFDEAALNKIKILVEAGADINYKDEYGNCVLKEAILQENMEAVYYLLQKGADFSGVLIDRSDFSDHEEKLYIQDVLNELNFSTFSEKYEYKQKIIEFLKSKGVKF